MATATLFCPIAPAISKHLARARSESLKWVAQHRLVRDDARLQAFDRLGIAEFVARAYPDADYEALRVVLDWTLWGFLADDQHDSLVRRPELLRARYLEHAEVLEHGMTDHVTGMHDALADIRDRVLAQSHPGCLRRFAEASRDWFESMGQEIDNRVRSTPPSIAQYLRLRERTVGMYTEYALFDVTHHLRTDDEFWIDPDVRRLMAMAANIIGWSNDVFSFSKEREAGDPHNIVLLYTVELGLEQQAAVERTAAMHNREMLRFVELEASVRAQRWTSPALMDPFLGLLRAWIRGNLDWALASDRYGELGEIVDVSDELAMPSARRRRKRDAEQRQVLEAEFGAVG